MEKHQLKFLKDKGSSPLRVFIFFLMILKMKYDVQNSKTETM